MNVSSSTAGAGGRQFGLKPHSYEMCHPLVMEKTVYSSFGASSSSTTGNILTASSAPRLNSGSLKIV